ncbi:antifreeze protein [Salipiger sp. IMCC34102]|uniref:antifreeze protein n=1 Tax=Salipiger sp. IMCC34102 TaxID=2510647 RepID=UPI00101C754B|nr:antifreeze protein [Salipiger sp. IMCC34102]RYH01702.1 antifreeze protein [Salipiger sp. IMCC34102]
MPRAVTPFDLIELNMEVGLMLTEAQMVIAMRMMGMGGLWSVTKSENARMVSEKAEALTRSAQAAGLAAMSGQRPDQIMQAAVKPLRAKTRANAHRLGRRGFKLR